MSLARVDVPELGAYLEHGQLACSLIYGRLDGLRSRLHLCGLHCATSIVLCCMPALLQSSIHLAESLYLRTRSFCVFKGIALLITRYRHVNHSDFDWEIETTLSELAKTVKIYDSSVSSFLLAGCKLKQNRSE